jgi:uncharacterized membrane protein (UPF0182 family)
MSESEPGDSQPASAPARESSGSKIGRLIKFTAFFGLLLIVLLMAGALLAALTAAETWAPVIQIFRDVFLVILLLESLLIVAAVTVLLLQMAGFLIMLKSEVKPILDNARETTRLSKATAQFINSNAVDPLIQIKSFLAGLLAFLRELILLRGIVLPEEPNTKSPEPDETSQA